MNRRNLTKTSGLFGCFLFLLTHGQAVVATPKAAPIEFMFYNVYNLFDNEKDQGKDDWTWLPSNYPGKSAQCKKIPQKHYRQECFETNWTTPYLKLKVAQLRKAITHNQRSMVPDILALCEVENKRIVQALAQSMGYDPRAVISADSPDRRGIDVALVYRPSANLKYRSHREYRLPKNSDLTKPTRNILEVEFTVGGDQQLFVYVNHWPSQGAPSPARIVAAKTLRKIIEGRMKTHPQANILAAGDFNTIPEDRPHPFHDELLESNVPGAKLADVHTTFLRHPKIPADVKKRLAPGTYYYTHGKTWNLLDRFFVNKNLFDGQGLEFYLPSYRINNPKFLTRPWELRDGSNQTVMIPNRSNFKTLDPNEAGFSDHFGIRGHLVIK